MIHLRLEFCKLKFMRNEVEVNGKLFRISVSAEQIQARVTEIAGQMNTDFAGKDVVFLCILNGSFMFAADLLRGIDMPCKISFVKFTSYEGRPLNRQCPRAHRSE